MYVRVCVSDWEYKCTTGCVRVRVSVCVREWVRVLDYSSVCVRVHVWVCVSEWVWEIERKKEVERERERVNIPDIIYDVFIRQTACHLLVIDYFCYQQNTPTINKHWINFQLNRIAG